MRKSLFTLLICCKILILSIFRANLKNDQKNDINVQFSHPLQTVCTNQSGSKETLYFFFICRNQIFHYQLSFWYIWKKSWKFWRFFEKSNQKINELFNFKFQNEFFFAGITFLRICRNVMSPFWSLSVERKIKTLRICFAIVTLTFRNGRVMRILSISLQKTFGRAIQTHMTSLIF